jgi:hypothetical protein
VIPVQSSRVLQGKLKKQMNVFLPRNIKEHMAFPKGHMAELSCMFRTNGMNPD